MNKLGLYIHIPFCETKCPYCDFNTYSGIENLIPQYIESLKNELSFWGSKIRDKYLIDTIFLGGGTPSYLPSNHLTSIDQQIVNSLRLDDDLEFTMEVNPGDLIASRLNNTHDTHINRLSIGVQSLDDSVLKVIGRRHTADDASKAFHIARQLGFKNISIDLMYGIPYQTMAQWEETVQKSIKLNPEHISAYCLTLEEGTPMEHQVRLGTLPEPNADLAADMYTAAGKILAEAGYINYEISNWSQLGMESKHNLRYWLNDEYIGIGPGAHSYLQSLRFYNLKSPRQYIEILQELVNVDVSLDDLSENLHVLPFISGYEHIDKQTSIIESIMLGLRLSRGVSKRRFRKEFGMDIKDMFPNQITSLTSAYLIEDTGDYIRLTHDAKLLANEVIIKFLE